MANKTISESVGTIIIDFTIQNSRIAEQKKRGIRIAKNAVILRAMWSS